MAQATIERAATDRPPSGRARRQPGAALGRWSLRGVAFLYLGLFIVLPVIAIIDRGFSDGFGNLSEALGSFGAWNAIKLTLIMATLTAVINGVLGTLLAYVLVRVRFPGRGLLSTIVDLPFAVPTLVAGVMLVALYGPNSAVGGWFEDHGIQIIFAPLGILLALLFVTLPLVVRSVQPVLLELDPAEEEAARVLGAGRWTTFRRSCCRRSARPSPPGRCSRSPGASVNSARSSSSRATSRTRRSPPRADLPAHLADPPRPPPSRRCSSGSRSCWCW